MITRHLIGIVLLWLFALLPAYAAAQEPATDAAEELVSGPTASPRQQEVQPIPDTPPEPAVEQAGETPAPPPERSVADNIIEGIDMLHSGISSGLLSTAAWLDSFFADERSLKEENNSYIRLNYTVFREERTATYVRPRFGVRLVLPQLQKKTHLVLAAEPLETTGSTAAPSGTTAAQTKPSDERNVTAALDYRHRITPKESFIIRTGAQISKGKPVLFIAPRYRSYLPLNAWGFRFTQELMYRTDTRWTSDTAFDLERPLLHDLFFRTSISGRWMENTHGYFYYLSCSIRQPFDLVHALQYEWINSYHTRPTNELMDIAFIIRYRQNILRKWIFFELAPQYRFPRERNFDGTPGITFNFEMLFGR